MKYLLFLMLISNSVLSFCQEYSVKQFSIDDGLPSAHVYEVKQDKQGFYWVATNKGVVKYDGYTFSQIQGENSPFNKDIWWTYQDSKSRIWGLGLGTKMWFLEGDSFKYKHLVFEGKGSTTAFHKMYEDKDGYFWLISGSSLFGFKDNDYYRTRYKQINPSNSYELPNLHKGKDGNLYYITKYPIEVRRVKPKGEFELIHSYEEGIYSDVFSAPTKVRPSLSAPLNYDSDKTTFIAHSPDTLYVISQGKIRSLINGTSQSFGAFPNKELLANRKYKVTCLDDIYVFINPSGSGSFATDHNFNHLKEFDFLKNYNVNTVFQDYEESIWIATQGQGLLFITREALGARVYGQDDKTGSEVVAIDVAKSGEKWIGFKDGRIGQFYENEFKSLSILKDTEKQGQAALRDLTMVDDNLVVMVGFFELQYFKLKELRLNGPAPTVIDGFVSTISMNVGVDRSLYLADYYGAYKIDFLDSYSHQVTTINPFRSVGATSTQSGKHLISSFDSLYVKGDESQSLSMEIRAEKFENDAKNQTWILHNDRGVSRIESGQIKSFVPLASYQTRDLFFEGDSSLWAATSRGLIHLKFNPTTNDYEYLRKLSLANGLLTNDVQAIVTDSEYLYVGTSMGFSVIDRTRLNRSKSKIGVLLTNVSSKGEKLVNSAQYVLEPDQNALEFSYVYISPKSAGQVGYEYKLEGIDSEWKQTNETVVNYPFLPAGNYRFQVRAKDINGVPSREGLDIKVQVKEFWWKTAVFQISLMLFVILATIIIFVVRLRQLGKRQKERNEMNNRIAELKLNALQSQMNPHFVFNVLNSIQDGYLNNDLIEANKYMTDFAKLMRLFLESSDEKYITLEKELKLLSYYIELEKMRLENKFEYELSVDPEIDLEEVHLPTMLIQPIIENAIMHGLRHKEGVGKLSLQISISNETSVLIAIEDNGIGRARSEEINSGRSNKHESKASSIIKDRIDIINKTGSEKIEMKYVDLFDGKKPNGTRVELILDLEINR